MRTPRFLLIQEFTERASHLRPCFISDQMHESDSGKLRCLRSQLDPNDPGNTISAEELSCWIATDVTDADLDPKIGVNSWESSRQSVDLSMSISTRHSAMDRYTSHVEQRAVHQPKRLAAPNPMNTPHTLCTLTLVHRFLVCIDTCILVIRCPLGATVNSRNTRSSGRRASNLKRHSNLPEKDDESAQQTMQLYIRVIRIVCL